MKILRKKRFWLTTIAVFGIIFVIAFIGLKQINNENDYDNSSSYFSSNASNSQLISSLNSESSTPNSQENNQSSNVENKSETIEEKTTSSQSSQNILENDVTIVNQNATKLTIPKLDLVYPSNMNLSESVSGLYNNYTLSRERGISLVISTSEPFGTDAGGYCSDEYIQINDKVVRMTTKSSEGTIFRYSPSSQTIYRGNESFDRQLELLPINGTAETQKSCVPLLPRFTKNIDLTEMWVIGRIEQNCTSCIESIGEYEGILLDVLKNSLQ